MTAYFLVTMKAENLSWAEDYARNVPAIMRKHGGEYFAVSDTVRRYEGNGPVPDRIVLLAFPSIEAIDAFVSDPDYAPFRSARLAATSGDAFGFTTAG